MRLWPRGFRHPSSKRANEGSIPSGRSSLRLSSSLGQSSSLITSRSLVRIQGEVPSRHRAGRPPQRKKTGGPLRCAGDIRMGCALEAHEDEQAILNRQAASSILAGRTKLGDRRSVAEHLAFNQNQDGFESLRSHHKFFAGVVQGIRILRYERRDGGSIPPACTKKGLSSSGQDEALSMLRQGFDSPQPRQDLYDNAHNGARREAFFGREVRAAPCARILTTRTTERGTGPFLVGRCAPRPVRVF
jgi:hypothetical protein